MAAHARNQIRDAAARLVTGLPTTAGQVFKTRTRPLSAGMADALLIFTTTDRRWAAGDAMGFPPIVGRQCALVIEGRVLRSGAGADEAAENALDQIEAELTAPLVNAMLGAAGAFRMLPVIAIDWQGTMKTLRAEGTLHIGAVRVEFAVSYRTPENDLTALV